MNNIPQLLPPTKLLRHKMRTQRRRLNAVEQATAARKVYDQLCNHPIIKDSNTIAGYLSSDHEISMLSWFHRAWHLSQECYLPIVLHQKLAFGHFTQQTTLHCNQWKILEPAFNALKAIDITQLDVAILPVVAFNLNGYRLGRGAGYYDRTFSSLLKHPRPNKPYLIGLAYEFQKTNLFEAHIWDVPLNEVITETKNYQF